MIFDMTKRKSGSGDVIAYTPIDRLTVLSNSSAGYDNKFVINNCTISDVKKIIAKVKYAASNSIWFACKKQNSADSWPSSAPYVNRGTGNGCTAVDGGVDADGYHEITVTINSSNDYFPCFGGAWPDSTFGKDVSFKTIRGYDANDTVLFDLTPGVLKNGDVVMINQTAGTVLSASLYKSYVVIAGEVV